LQPGQPEQPKSTKEAVDQQRYEILELLEDWLEIPVMILGGIWLILLVVELIWGLSPFLNNMVLFIWGVFVVDFLLRFVLAPQKITYIKRNWLTLVSLFIPALRIGRIVRMAGVFRALQATRGVRLVVMVGSLNRGMRVLRNTMRRRGFGYVIALSFLVLLVGGAGMFFFEGPGEAGMGLRSYGEALWWTAMIMTTMGSDMWPQSAEGRMLNLLLALYAFAVFGYVTATLATFFIGQDAASVLEETAQPAAPLLENETEQQELTRQTLDTLKVAGQANQKDRGIQESRTSALEVELLATRKQLAELRSEMAALRQLMVEQAKKDQK
jgi:voltage-gated potassium channel